MPRTAIPAELRRLVEARAHGCCEYCLLHEDDAESSHQVDHLSAIKHGGAAVSENLALACQLCNRYKGFGFGGDRPDKWGDRFVVQSAHASLERAL